MFLDDQIVQICDEHVGTSVDDVTKTWNKINEALADYATSNIKAGISYKEYADALDKLTRFEEFAIKKLKKNGSKLHEIMASMIESYPYVKGLFKQEPHLKDIYEQGKQR